MAEMKFPSEESSWEQLRPGMVLEVETELARQFVLVVARFDLGHANFPDEVPQRTPRIPTIFSCVANGSQCLLLFDVDREIARRGSVQLAGSIGPADDVRKLRILEPHNVLGLPCVCDEPTLHSDECVRLRFDGFEAQVWMDENGQVRADWRAISVSAEQWKYGGYSAAGPWSNCSSGTREEER